MGSLSVFSAGIARFLWLRKLSSQVQHFIRGEKIEALTRSVVNQMEDSVQLINRKIGKIGAFREKETQKAINVFITAALPGSMRIGKENFYVGLLFQIFEAKKFGAVVQSQGKRLDFLQPAKCFKKGSVGRFNGLILGDSGDKEPRTSVNSSNQIPLANRAINRIAFKIPKSSTHIDDFIAFMDGRIEKSRIGLFLIGIQLTFPSKMSGCSNSGKES